MMGCMAGLAAAEVLESWSPRRIGLVMGKTSEKNMVAVEL